MAAPSSSTITTPRASPSPSSENNFGPLENALSLKGEGIDLLEDKYLSFELNIFKVPLQYLKNVKVMPFCSRTLSFDAIKLYQFLKFLLEHAIKPNKVVIVSEHKNCNICSTNTSNLMRHLLDFPTSTIISIGPISHN
ncbi:hypothetical protein H5410_060702, partial [Solanum commersonii]